MDIQNLTPSTENLSPNPILDQADEPIVQDRPDPSALFEKSEKPPEADKEEFNAFIQYARKHYPTWFNQATIALHTLGAMLPYVSIVPSNISKGIKKFAESFSRYGIPLVKILTGAEALSGKRLFEFCARVIPPLTLPIFRLPFFNFQLAYGLSSAVNVVLEHMSGRIGTLSKDDSFKTNNKKVIDCFKSMCFDLFKNKETNIKERTKLGLALGGAGLMLPGALLGLIFAKDSLNSLPARIFGSIRSIGGVLGDLSIILFSSQPKAEQRRKEKIVGSFYLIPSVMDFLQRWINQSSDANEIFNHAKTALNTIAEVLWSSFSIDKNIEQEKSNQNKNEIIKFPAKPEVQPETHLASAA